MFDRLIQIELFCSIGLPLTDNNVCLVSSWEEAEFYCRSESWGEVQLEERNKFTLKLNSDDASALDNWSRDLKLVRSQLEDAINQHLEDKFFIRNYKAVFNSVLWDFISIAMISNCSDIECSNFYSTLFKYYDAGHFPCGWKGAWPEGRLMVY